MADPLRVLIVDDEMPARNRLRDLLSDCNETLPLTLAGEAGNGIQALEWLNQHAADVALLDINMPGMSGIELAQHMLKLPHPPAIIFTTAYDQFALQAFEVNAVDYLLKPIKQERLAAALAARAPNSIRRTKALMRDAEGMWALMQKEGAVFGDQMKSPEAMEAFMAFTQKRAPDFSKAG